MTTFLIILITLILLFVGYFFVLGQKSKSAEPPGLTGDQLTQCPNKPNCVCSEYAEDNAHYIAPIDVTGVEANVVLTKIKAVIISQGGELKSESDRYQAYIFSSSLFGFVDDVEVRFDADKNALHIRSASRVGHSDMGVNKKRVEAIKAAFAS